METERETTAETTEAGAARAARERGGQDPQSTIVVGAGGLTFVTEDGRPLARLGARENGASFTLLNRAGEELLQLAVSGDFAAVIAGDADRGHAHLAATPGRGAARVFDGAGDLSAEMMADSSGNGNVAVCAPGGRPVARMAGEATGGSFQASAPDSPARAALGVHPTGDGGLLVYDRHDVGIFCVPVWLFQKPHDGEGSGGEGGTDPAAG